MTARRARVEIHTDGACRGNPGPGGWGAVLAAGARVKELRGGEAETTNNRMELMAAIAALESLTRPARVELYTDSRYLHDGITEWIGEWKRRGWRTAAKKPVKNVDLWHRLDAALGPHEVHWHWVRGHAGNAGNERADALARQALAEIAPTPPGAPGAGEAVERPARVARERLRRWSRSSRPGRPRRRDG